jgi:hypothetical protein
MGRQESHRAVTFEAFEGSAENDDFSSPSRLKENCIRFVTELSSSGRLFFPRNGARSTPAHGSRGNSRPLFLALSFAET